MEGMQEMNLAHVRFMSQKIETRFNFEMICANIDTHYYGNLRELFIDTLSII